MKSYINAQMSTKKKIISILLAGALLISLVPPIVSATGTSSIGDTLAPTAPSNLTFTSGNSTSLSMKWNASSDNYGVVAYEIYRTNYGILAGVVSGTTYTFTDTGLTPGTPYSYSVKAVDAAGNKSNYSNPIGITLPTQ